MVCDVPLPFLHWLGLRCGMYSFPSVKLLRKNTIALGHEFGDPILLRQDRENIKHKVGSLKDTTLTFPGMVPDT